MQMLLIQLKQPKGLLVRKLDVLNILQMNTQVSFINKSLSFTHYYYSKYDYTFSLLLLEYYIISDPPLDVLLCDPGCSSLRNSLEMQSIAFFTFSAHSLQCNSPFCSIIQRMNIRQKGLLHNSGPLQEGQLGRQPKLLRHICILRDALCTCCLK